MPGIAPSPLERLLDAEKVALVRQVVDELEPERDRQLLRRFYLGEEDKDVLCRDLGLTSQHFNRVLFRARQRYRELYERRVRGAAGTAPGLDSRREPAVRRPRYGER
jgi:RNA polymerase sigma-70 factor (ECF subfamily)